jgi:hypothetical protein
LSKQLTLARIARGKLDKDVDKEFDNVTKQVEDKFNGILNKLNAYDIRNSSELRKIDLNTATLGESMNVLASIVKDLKEILST